MFQRPVPRAAPAASSAARRPTILVADDEPVNRALIRGLLRRNFDVIEAATGAEAVARASADEVDVVVMDIHMPGMSGFQATPLIKASAGERFLPVILMTASNEDALLSEGLERGADDFLLKPISRILLEAKINALLRAADVFRVLCEQNHELAQRRARAERDYELARGVFDLATRRSHFNLPDLIIGRLSVDTFNGDVVLAAPVGHSLRLLVGDFAGHGLAAAVGALPTSEVFFAMTRQSFGLGDLARELGGKLHTMFPRDLFLAVCLVDVDLEAGRLLVWNAGLPDVLVFQPDGALARRVASERPPLGILNGEAVDRSLVEVAFPPGSRLAIYSDGLPESRAEDGSMFGTERIEEALTRGSSARDWTAPLRAAHATFCAGTSAQEDDVTFVGLTHTPALATALASEQPAPAPGYAARTSVHVRFDPDALRRPEPLAPLLELLATPALFGPRGLDAQAVLTELFTNAVDHGLLALDTKSRDAPADSLGYRRLREERLAGLTAGLVTITLSVARRSSGPAIVIKVAGTGRGFSMCEEVPAPVPCAKAGRGLQLVRALSQELEFSEGGTTVEAVLTLAQGSP